MDSQRYERMVHKHEEDQLAYYTEKANVEKNIEEDKKLFLNMSIRDILKQMSITFVDIITDLTSGKATNLRDILKILFKEDRMVFIGVLILLISFGIYIVDITN